MYAHNVYSDVFVHILIYIYAYIHICIIVYLLQAYKSLCTYIHVWGNLLTWVRTYPLEMCVYVHRTHMHLCGDLLHDIPCVHVCVRAHVCAYVHARI